MPWVQRDNVHLEVLYQVTNLDTEAGMFDVAVDGASQYTKYDENIVAPALSRATTTRPTYLPLISLHAADDRARPDHQGILREDDFDEAERDLDAMGRWMAPFVAVLINRSDVNPIGLEMVPRQRRHARVRRGRRHLHRQPAHAVRVDAARARRRRSPLHVAGDPHFKPKPALFQPPADDRH